MNQVEVPTSYELRKAREIILVAFRVFGLRLEGHWVHRPVHDLYLFLRRSRHFPKYLGTDDMIFLEVFACGNKYAALLDLDEEGCVKWEVPSISVDEAIECANEMGRKGYELLAETVKKLLRTKVGELKLYEGPKAIELLVAAELAHG